MQNVDPHPRPAELSDDELMAMFSGGEVEAFDTLFDRYHVPVYNFALFMLHDVSGAEEIMQETFVVVARAADRYEPLGRFKAWIMGIVRNRCLGRMEAERARRAVMADGALAADEAASPDPPPEERVELDERLGLLQRAIAGLPDRQREVIVLYAFERMQYREIADALGMPMGTAKTLIHRARAALAAALGGSQKENDDAV